MSIAGSDRQRGTMVTHRCHGHGGCAPGGVQLGFGLALNIALRLAMLAMVAEVLRAKPDDPRFAGKGIAIRFTAVGLPATLLVPALWAWNRRRRVARGMPPDPYPAWVDGLYVSVFALDLAGNVFDMYDTYTHFDLIPHAHGAGAITVLAAWLFRLPVARAIIAAMVGHALLEGQEYASDVAFGLHNVRGAWDVAGDLGAGLAGSLVYAAAYRRFVRDAEREPPSPLS
jgi:hypothetical protein